MVCHSKNVNGTETIFEISGCKNLGAVYLVICYKQLRKLILDLEVYSLRRVSQMITGRGQRLGVSEMFEMFL